MFSETKVIFLDFYFNSNKRIARANHNSRLGNYNNTNLILKTTEWMIYKVFSLYYLHHFTPLAAVSFSGNFWDSFKSRCFWAWGFVFVLLCSFTNSKVACVASVSLRFRSKERGMRVKERAKNGSRFISRAAKTGLSLLRNQITTTVQPNGNACYAG